MKKRHLLLASLVSLVASVVTAFAENKPTDSSFETKVICREEGRYLGWPTVCRLRSGELLVVFSGDRDQHFCPWGKVQMIRSKDDGRTWSKPETIQNGILDDRDAGIVELKDGTLVLNWFTSIAFYTGNTWKGMPDPKRRDEGAQYVRHYLSLPQDKVRATLGYWSARSTDGGKTWSKPVRMTSQLPHEVTALRDGRLLCVGRRSNEAGQCPQDGTDPAKIGHRIICEESTDGGKSWHVLADLVPADGVKMTDLHEPHMAELPDGRLVAQVRWHGNPAAGSHGMGIVQSESADGGKTWTKMVPTPIVGFPPHLLNLKDGRLLTVYAKRIPGICGEYACLSSDGGRTWDVKNEICLCPFANGDLGYPSSVQLADGSIYTVYYQPPKLGEPTAIMATRWRPPHR